MSCEDELLLAACESKNITLGNYCMFYNKIQLETSDSHSILYEKAERINLGGDIEIGNLVWIGNLVVVLNGTTIPDNCIVGARSIVTASLCETPNSIITGILVGGVKTNINWKRERI